MKRQTYFLVSILMGLGALLAGPGCGDDSGGLSNDGSVSDAQDATGLDGGDTCPSNILCGPYEFCCEEGQECVNDFQCLPICEFERCGDNLEECCAAGQQCLDGVVCARDCGVGEDLCGANLDECCNAADVCLNDVCITPGLICSNNFDCLDSNYYCETTISRCLPLPTGPLCEGDPNFTDIQPVLEWYWPGVDYNGRTYRNVFAAPAVGDVNGDGTPDVVVVAYSGSTSEHTLIVVLDGAGDGSGNGLVLFTIPSAGDPTAPEPYWGSAVALANFDGDTGLEIVYGIDAGGVRIADNTGVGDLGVRTSGSANTVYAGGPSVSDLDHDGMPDVIVRCHAMNGLDISDSALDFMDVTGCGPNTVVADLDQDGRPEVISGTHATTADASVVGGEPLWTQNNGLISGFVAVADLLPSHSGPEVINIHQEFTLLNGQTGSVLIGPGGTMHNGSVPIPGAGFGGAPTVADFDGDGWPEVSTAGRSAYVVYDPDCSDATWLERPGGQCASNRTDLILWTTVTQDLSSSRTGSSVFDFQGDGAAEVLYNDECFFHIYDGTTGSELVSPVIPSSSRTFAEYPLAADVDGDGNAEMVVIGNEDQARDRDNCDAAWKGAGVDINLLCQYTDCIAGPACDASNPCPDIPNPVGSNPMNVDAYQCDSTGTCQLAGGTHGVRIFGDANDRWVSTQTVWNQFAYHVTNVELVGGDWDVPQSESANWLTYNNYRQNVQGGTLFPVPDLQVELEALALCPDQVRLAVVVYNEGSLGVLPGVTLTFYRTDENADNPPEEVGHMTTTATILPGGWERLVLIYDIPELSVEMTFSVTTDNDGVIEECDEDNNTADSAQVLCPGGPG